MAGFSKVLMEYIKTADCRDITHSNSCIVNAPYKLYRFFISNAKYYAPIIALPALAKFRNLNRKVIEDMLLYYVECIVTGTAVGWTAVTCSCIFRYILGEFTPYTFLYIPSIISGLNIFWSTLRVQRMHTISVLQSTVESILMRRQNIFTKSIANSLFLQTLLFMLSSTIILQAKQNGIYRGFWLLTPDQSPIPSKSDGLQNNMETISIENLTKFCKHKEKSCFLHLIKGVCNYFAFGITLDFLKALIGNVPKDTIGFWNKIFAKCRKVQLNSAALLASYIGIYRLTYCYLNHKTNSNTSINHLAASFLSGVCYIFMPKLTWLSFALVLSVQILWKYFIAQKKVNSNESQFWSFITKLPYGKIFYMFSLAHLVHTYCFRSNQTSNLAHILLNNTTDFYAQKILFRMSDLDKFLTSTQ